MPEDAESKSHADKTSLKEVDANFYAEAGRVYSDRMLSYGIGLGFERETVRDAVQDVFCSLLSRSTSVAEINNLQGYLFRALKNRLLNIHRDSVSGKADANNLDFTIKVTVLDELISEEDRLQLVSAVEKYLRCLTARQREAIYLRYMAEMDYEQISIMLDMTVHGVRKLVSRAIQCIREQHPLLIQSLLLVVVSSN